MNLLLKTVVGIILSVSISTWSQVWYFEIEGGLAFPQSFDLQIPGKGGTPLSLTKELQTKYSLASRLSCGVNITENHRISFLLAPLIVDAQGLLSKDLLFDSQLFPSQTAITAKVFFNSYRVTYRYTFQRRGNWLYGCGCVAKIRDASIKIASKDNTVKAIKTNSGFVPLVHLFCTYYFTEDICVRINADALAATQGRAVDAIVALVFRISDKRSVSFGYRVLEGGSDNDQVYTSALIHYAVFGVTYTF